MPVDFEGYLNVAVMAVFIFAVCLAALEAALRQCGHAPKSGAGVDAAFAIYRGAESA